MRRTCCRRASSLFLKPRRKTKHLELYITSWKNDQFTDPWSYIWFSRYCSMWWVLTLGRGAPLWTSFSSVASGILNINERPLLWQRAVQIQKEWHGFLPVCVLLCVTKQLESEKTLPQSWHTKGLSFVWTLVWTLKLSAWCIKALPQSWHTKGLSFVWTLV